MDIYTLYTYGSWGFLILSLLFFIGSVILIRPYRRLYALMLIVPIIVSVGYFLMSNGIGMLVQNEMSVNITRYVDWILTTPILLFMLCYTMYSDTKRRKKMFLLIAGLDIGMLIAGLGAELTTGNTQALLFSVSSLAFLAMLYLIVDGMLKLNSQRSDTALRRTALRMAWIIMILCSIYPFVWILSPTGLSILSDVQSTILYLLMDISTKFGFAVYLLRFLYLESKLITPQSPHETN
jgi:sensory rhodopsin